MSCCAGKGDVRNSIVQRNPRVADESTARTDGSQGDRKVDQVAREKLPKNVGCCAKADIDSGDTSPYTPENYMPVIVHHDPKTGFSTFRSGNTTENVGCCAHKPAKPKATKWGQVFDDTLSTTSASSASTPPSETGIRSASSPPIVPDDTKLRERIKQQQPHTHPATGITVYTTRKTRMTDAEWNKVRAEQQVKQEARRPGSYKAWKERYLEKPDGGK